MPIYIFGLSVGATTAIMATGSGLPKNVKGVIADSPSSLPSDVGRQTIKNLHLSPAFFYSQIRRDSYLRLHMMDDDYTSFIALEKNESIPILFIHGDRDRVSPVRMTEDMFEKCKSPKEKYIVKGAGHIKSYYLDTENYQKKLLEFFNKYDD